MNILFFAFTFAKQNSVCVGLVGLLLNESGGKDKICPLAATDVVCLHTLQLNDKHILYFSLFTSVFLFFLPMVWEFDLTEVTQMCTALVLAQNSVLL